MAEADIETTLEEQHAAKMLQALGCDPATIDGEIFNEFCVGLSDYGKALLCSVLPFSPEQANKLMGES